MPRVPGAAQHEVVRCRPGTAKAPALAIPHLRCTAYALHRVRDTAGNYGSARKWRIGRPGAIACAAATIALASMP
jgi:hypothetical protein